VVEEESSLCVLLCGRSYFKITREFPYSHFVDILEHLVRWPKLSSGGLGTAHLYSPNWTNGCVSLILLYSCLAFYYYSVFLSN
jgi:hypothetical protein